MHCKNCDYALWNLRTRTCPECGEAFRPGDFEFAAGTVEFHCPHCDQAYYGTTDRGHLNPPAFECVTCGRHIHMDEMVLRPAAGVDEKQTRKFEMPWLERDKVGRIRAWFTMIGRALVAPARLMRGTPPESSAGQAWWFALVTGALTLLAGFVPAAAILALFIGIGLAAGGGGGGGAGGAAVGFITIFLLGVAVTLYICLIIAIALWGATTHLLLQIGGGVERTIGTTYKAICYSSGANILTAVPCLGNYGLGVIWWIVSAILMTKEAHRIGGGRATFAVLTPPLGAFVLFVTGYVALMMYVSTVAAPGPGFAYAGPVVSTPQPTTQVRNVVLHLRASAAINDGRPPEHGLQLLDAGMRPDEFVSYQSRTQTTDVTIPGGTLADYYSMLFRQRQDVDRIAGTSLPDGVIAHRIGDLVFTYHGIDIINGNPDLWVVVCCDDPAVLRQFAEPASIDPIAIGCVDGTPLVIARSEFPAALRRQNQLRRAEGLPPLPDLLAISGDSPATED